MNMSTAERAAVEAYLDRLTRDMGELANRLDTLKTQLCGPASPGRPHARQAVSLDRRSQRGAP